MDKQVKLTMTEAQRYEVIKRLDRGDIPTSQAAELIGRSPRHTRRLLAASRQHGIAAFAHGNRGRTPANAIPEELRQEVLRLATADYMDFNDRHLRDTLEDHHAIHLSPATVRRLRRNAGCPPVRKRRASNPHRRRERKPQAGMMLQIDGSPYHWLGQDQPPCTLLVAIDDATSEVFALFRPAEDTFGYLALLRHVVGARGIPLALYSDRHAIFGGPHTALDTSPQSNRKPPQAQFPRVARELGIQLIQAHSPQAKGRVERVFATLQDRLVKELARQGIEALDAANQFLRTFVKRFNRRFTVTPSNPEPAWRQAPSSRELDDLFAFLFVRVIRKDHTVNFAGASLDLPHTPGGSLAGKKAQIRVHLNGRLSFWLKDQRLGDGPRLKGEPSPDPKALKVLLSQVVPPKPKPALAPKTRNKRREPVIVVPAKDHPWRRPCLTSKRRSVVPSLVSGGG